MNFPACTWDTSPKLLGGPWGQLGGMPWWLLAPRRPRCRGSISALRVHRGETKNGASLRAQGRAPGEVSLSAQPKSPTKSLCGLGAPGNLQTSRDRGEGGLLPGEGGVGGGQLEVAPLHSPPLPPAPAPRPKDCKPSGTVALL